MASGSSSYEGVSMHDNSRAQFGHNINSREAQNFPGQTVHGTQNVYIGNESPQTHPGRCVSVPFATVSTYSDRPDLSKELDEKLARQHGNTSSRAVAVIGLGGTGKTQLVLHYIDAHEAEYETILWIDARDKETARASFERCCWALGLPVETLRDDRPLQDVPFVQAVLSLLRARTEDKKWLMVIDNADDFSWGVGSIVPRGKAGTVLMTSQDGQVSRLLGGLMSTVKVDAMRLDEAVQLMANHLGEPITRGDDHWNLVEKITECLDRLALPLDLAGARISVDAENWGDLTAALERYLKDYGQNQKRLLHDTEYANETQYKKTVWTAWETSLSSLKAREENNSGMYPAQLLAFLTLFDRANVQDELFRLAGLGLYTAFCYLNATVPSWLQSLLEKDSSNEWNSLLYRDTIACLLRYHLVRPVIEPWKGITMHGLVQKRARQELTPGHCQWHMIFLHAICHQVNEVDHVQFRRHLTVHFPPHDKILADSMPFQSNRQRTRLWMSIGNVWDHEGRAKEAAGLYAKAADVMKETFGVKDPETLAVLSNLALFCSNEGFYKEAKKLNSKVLRLREAELGATDPVTLTSRHLLTMILSNEGQWEDAAQQQIPILEARRAVLGNHHRDTLYSMTTLAISYVNLGKLSRAQELQFEIFETMQRLFGRAHPDTISSMSTLALTYSKQGKHQESEELQLEALQAATHLFGDDHEETLRNMGHLGTSYVRQGKLKEDEELQIKLLERSEKIYGRHHPKILSYTRDLARTRSMQGKLVEANQMLVDVFKAELAILGDEHPETLETMDDIAVILLHQERWEAAEKLISMTIAASSRALGATHPYTLEAMAKLARAKRGLGQNNVAVDLMRQSATTSLEVLGDDHPDTEQRRDQVVEWLIMDSQRV